MSPSSSIRLESNFAVTSPGNRAEEIWSGFATGRIDYPGLDTCITVTFLLQDGRMSGCHLYRRTTVTYFQEVLTRIGVLAKSAKKMYLVGMLRGWDESALNLTGAVFSPTEGGTLITQLRKAANFTRPVDHCDLSDVDRGGNDALDVEAILAGDTINFSHVVKNATTRITLTPIGGDMLPPRRMPCIIL